MSIERKKNIDNHISTEAFRKEEILESKAETEKNIINNVKKLSADFFSQDKDIEKIEVSVNLNNERIDEVKNSIYFEKRIEQINNKFKKLIRVIICKLEKIPYSLLKTVLVAELLTGGGFLYFNNRQEKIESDEQEETIIEKYKSPNNCDQIKKDTTEYISDNFILEVALTIKNYETEHLIKEKDLLFSIYSSTINNPEVSFNESDSLEFIKQEKNLTDKIFLEQSKLTKEEKNNAKEKILELITLVEKAKLEVIDHIKSDEYLKKIMKEMNISKEIAKKHQKMRIWNVANTLYNLKTDSGISMDTGNPSTYAYYSMKENKICIPYNLNLEDKTEREYFYEALLHELFHASTMSSMGIDNNTWNSLKNSFNQKDSLENKENIDYFSDPIELICRKQILDLEMEKLNIKKYGKKFTEKHYQKLIELKKNNKLSKDSKDFIEHIKPEDFFKIMNKIAENTKQKKDYYYQDQNYGDQNNQEDIA